ncbi:hypothetical protein GIB67_026154 [Kingdonia uniflora]|uniref:Angio-associated migratory cell protein n=1 Tax=Kingdonia uniflora TaxID=39325 RepID=A0A7J7M3D6_9MAGN|nr:hypothetical protein GIB67_026154 [Kingdonia uniflora]
MNGDGEGDFDQGEFFIDEDDVLEEINIDEEDLPDATEEGGSDGDIDDVDDSVHLFTGHAGELYTVACSPKVAGLVATGGGDDRGFLWKIGQGDWHQELQGHADSVSSLAFSADGRLLASGDLAGSVRVWDISSNSFKCALEGPGKGIEWVRWHPRGPLVLAGSEDSNAWMWNAERNEYLMMFSGHSDSVTCGNFTPDGRRICTGSKDKSLRVWNPINGDTIHVVTGYPYHTEGLTCMDMSTNPAVTSKDVIAITGSSDGSVHLVNITAGKVVSSLIAHSNSIECVGISPSTSYPWAATGSMDKKLIIWDLQRSVPRCTCEHKEGEEEGEGVTCLIWLGLSQYVATGTTGGKVYLWDSLSGHRVKLFRGHSDVIQSLSISADGKYIVSVSIDQTARVFEIEEFQIQMAS